MVIRWTPSVINDLKTISSHIERERNLATANRVCRTIYDTVQILRRFPESAKSVSKRELVNLWFRLCPISWRIE
jgi:plasmid stabilization system protein ParE